MGKKSRKQLKCTQMIVVSFVTKSKRHRHRHGGIVTLTDMVVIVTLPDMVIIVRSPNTHFVTFTFKCTGCHFARHGKLFPRLCSAYFYSQGQDCSYRETDCCH